MNLPTTAWLLMLALHTGVLLCVAWAIDRAVPNLRGAWRELLWRTALFGGLLTATVQAFAPQQSPVGRWHWPASVIALPAEPAPAPGAGSADNGGAATAHVATPVSAIVRGHTFIQAPAAVDAAGFITIASSSRWTPWLLVIWTGGALLAIARMLRGLLRLWRELAQAVPIASAELREDLAALARCVGVQAPQLLPGHPAEPDRGRQPSHRAAALGARYARPRATARDAGA